MAGLAEPWRYGWERSWQTKEHMMTTATLLWIIAAILVIAGIYVALARKQVIFGVVLIVLGLLVGPGGVSIFNA